MIVKQIVQKGKRVLKKDEVSLSQLQEDLGLGYIELVVTRLCKEVKTNIFETIISS